MIPTAARLQILEQNYRNDPISQELLLSFYEGKTIDFIVQTPDGKHRERQDHSQRIRSQFTITRKNYQQPAYTQPIIEVDGVLRFGMPGQPLFPALSGDSILKPTLNWLLRDQ